MRIPKPQKRGDAYRIQIMINGHRHSATRDTARECEQWAADLILKHKAGEKLEKRESMTLDELLTLYYENVARHRRSAKTDYLIIQAFKRDYADIVAMQLHEVTPRILTEWRDHRLLSASASTVRRNISTLSAAMTYAVKELFIIDINPFLGMTKPQETAARTRRISCEETDLIIEALGYEYGSSPESISQLVAWSFLFAQQTAMRRSEILRMTAEHDFARYVHIPVSKNDIARDVPLTEEARRLLDLLPNGVVGVKPEAFKSAWQRGLAKTGIKNLQFRDSRHEGTSTLKKRFKDPLDLCKATGHTDLKMIMKVYYNPTGDELADGLIS